MGRGATFAPGSGAAPHGLIATTRRPPLPAAPYLLADGLGLSRDRTVAAIASTAPVPGRFEVVDVGRPFDVVVDFAYSVGSVAAVLAAARALVTRREGRLVTVLAIVGRAGQLMAGARRARGGTFEVVIDRWLDHRQAVRELA